MNTMEWIKSLLSGLVGGADGYVPTFRNGRLVPEASAGGTPTAITVANEATDTTCFPLFVTAATGDLGPKTVSSLIFNSNTGALGSTTFELGHASDTTVSREAQGGAIAVEGKTVGMSVHLRGVLSGLGTSQAADADHDITIAAGAAADSAGGAIIYLSSAITKQLDASWAVGTNAGGLDTGGIASTTWYHLWLIRRSDTGVVDALFSTSATAPTMPTNYDQKCRIGSVLTDGSSNITDYVQSLDNFEWLDPPLDIDATNPGTSAVTRTLTVATGINVTVILNLQSNGNGANTEFYLSPLDVNDEAPSFTAAPLASGRASAAFTPSTGPLRLRTNTSGQIRSRLSASGSGQVLRIVTLGWVDPRGRT